MAPDMAKKRKLLLASLLAVLFAWASGAVWAGYKARRWDIRARDAYPSSLTSEGVTIAAEPLFTDALAAEVFDKNDMVTRGIMPLAIVIFNDNDFPIEVDGMTAELIHESEHTRTMVPNEVVYRLFKNDKSWISRQIPRMSKSELNEDALDDFDQKFLMNPVIAPHDKGGGFLYLHVAGGKDLAAYLSKSVVYIPNIYRRDDGSRMIFFEIELNASIGAQTGS